MTPFGVFRKGRWVRPELGLEEVAQGLQPLIKHLRRHAEGLPQDNGVLDVSHLHHGLEGDGGDEKGRGEGFRSAVPLGMNMKDRRFVRPFLRFAVPETKTSELSGDGKAPVFGGSLGVDADEKVFRVQYARLETKIFTVLDAKPR